MNWKKIYTLLSIASLLFVNSYSYAEKIVWIDVRSAIEHTIDNIEGDIRISHDEVTQAVSELYPNKETEIRLYCRSGGRAGKALQALNEAGYTNVANVGGIHDARKERGLTD